MADDNPYRVPCACDERETVDALPEWCGPKLILTKEEEEILASMRKLREESRHIKNQLNQLQRQASKQDLQARLAQLRDQFRQLRTDLEQANRIKMRRLGYPV
jgi:predicted nuclease with TOPRIM domain